MEPEILPTSPKESAPVVPDAVGPAEFPLGTRVKPWVAPTGTNGVPPTNQQYADSMGIDISAHKEIAVSPIFKYDFSY